MVDPVDWVEKRESTLEITRSGNLERTGHFSIQLDIKARIIGVGEA